MTPIASDDVCRAVNRTNGIGDSIPVISAAHSYVNPFVKSSVLHDGPGVFSGCPACVGKAYFCLHFDDVTFGNLGANAPANGNTNIFMYMIVEK